MHPAAKATKTGERCATLGRTAASAPEWKTRRIVFGICLVRQPEGGQRHAGQPNAESLQRLPPRYGLGQSFGQFIEFIIHNFPFVFVRFT
jgi:hypothetical protein